MELRRVGLWGKEGRTQVGSVERGVKDKERIKDV